MGQSPRRLLPSPRQFSPRKWLFGRKRFLLPPRGLSEAPPAALLSRPAPMIKAITSLSNSLHGLQTLHGVDEQVDALVLVLVPPAGAHQQRVAINRMTQCFFRHVEQGVSCPRARASSYALPVGMNPFSKPFGVTTSGCRPRNWTHSLAVMSLTVVRPIDVQRGLSSRWSAWPPC